MKIEQAVEKAKLSRVKSRPQAGAGAKIRPVEVAQGGWVPPAYTQSQAYDLDPQVLSENRCVCYFENAPELDYYKMLRTQITQTAHDKGWNTIMVTSVPMIARSVICSLKTK